MSVFGAYSKYYNLLYKDKDYTGEAQYVHEIIKKHLSGAVSVLDLGCGTGRLDFALADIGYEICGVDISDEMLVAARSRQSSLNFLSGDIRVVRLNRKFDVVVSLFHVMSYQITNEDLLAALASAIEHLNPGGLFIFDAWYGPAVLTDPPVVRVKRLDDEDISVVRIAEPVMRYNENVVDVNYEVLVTDKKTRALERLHETHNMRYFFVPEMAAFLKAAGFEIILYEEFMTGRQPGPDTWGVAWVCRKV